MTATTFLGRPDAGRRPRRRSHDHPTAPVLFALYFILIGCWSLATPPFGAPDEPSHVYRAVSVAQGQLLAPRSGLNVPDDPSNIVVVPGALAADAHGLGCFAHRAGAPASCMHLAGPPTGKVAVHSAAARYLPAYYAVVGWPTNFLHGLGALWAMRAVSVTLCAFLLTLATVAAFGLGRWMPLALLVATTPTVYFLAGGVNPDGVAICAAAAAWTLGLTAATGPPRLARSAARWWALPAVAMLMARADGVLWLAIIILALVVVARGRQGNRLRALGRARRTHVAVVVAAAISVGWTVYSGQTNIGPPPGWRPHADSLAARLGEAAGRLPLWWQQAVAGFGWRDTYLPGAVGLVLVFAAFALCWLSRPAGTATASALGLVLVTVLISLVAQAHGFDLLGDWWQGRYVLPALMGVPMLLALGTGRPGRTPGRIAASAVAIAVLGLNVAGLLVWLHRCMNGLGHRFVWNAPWSPPLDGRSLFVLGAAALAVLCGAAAHAAVSAADDGPAPSLPVPRRVHAHSA